MRRILAAVAAFAATAYSLPGDLVVLSAKEVRPDAGAGLYYLGEAAGGFLYNGDAGAVARVAPYRLLDRGARDKDYYVAWAPAAAALTAAAFKPFGSAAALGPNGILVGVYPGVGADALRTVDRRIELRRLTPVTPATWRYDGEPPPTRKDAAIETAINTITEQEYAGYIQALQNFGTRFSFTDGNAAARDYIRAFFAAQGLETTVFPFECSGFSGAHYRTAGGNIYLHDWHSLLRRSEDYGATWDNVVPTGINGLAAEYWLDGQTGFAAGVNKLLAKTHDGGDTWETVAFGQNHPTWRYYAYACYFLTADTGWLGGMVVFPDNTYAGFMLKTEDGGLTWTEQTVPEHFRPGGITFYDAVHGWASNANSNYNPTFIYTDDGGLTWRPCTDPTNYIAKINITATGAAEAWAADRTSNLLHTTDGLTWTYFSPGAGGNNYCVEFADDEHGYAAGSTLIATGDGGQTWHEVPNAPAMVYDFISFADDQHGVVGSTEGRDLFLTDDGGASFVDISSNVGLSADNVIGERRGSVAPEEIVVIGGHFDSYSDERPWVAPGAEDDASGVAAAMAAARALKGLPMKRTVRFVAFGDEEGGCNGSAAYASYCATQGEKIVAVLNADMVTYDEENGGRDDLSVAHHDSQYKWLYDYLKGVGALYGNAMIYDHFEWYADHAEFWDAGYAAIGAIEGEVGTGGDLAYPYYHTAQDTLDKLQPAFGARFNKDYAATLAHLARSEYVGVDEPTVPAGPAHPRVRPFAVYPNPYRYAKAGGVTFTGLAAPATIAVYDLAGRKIGGAAVAAGREEYSWAPRAADGSRLAPGLYLYRVAGQSQEETGKLVVTD